VKVKVESGVGLRLTSRIKIKIKIKSIVEGRGFRWLYASGTTIGSYRIETNRSQHSVRFIRAVATFLLKLAFTCFRWHKANGELNITGISR
jgi:hypothetical protein